MNIPVMAAVVAGGAFGSLLRYVSVTLLGRWLGSGFPWGTVFVNLLGSFIMGVLAELAARKFNFPEPLRAFLFVGILGGFTTFSTFSLDMVTLINRDVVLACLYGAVSVGLGIAALYAGLAVVRWGVL
ncbi:fluoride efflux transporter CrcB [Insolitispirillum peregrinum]|uniref:Fluoride-specific ion channel FluC n=1 Tax=Insolitispirillum peregrinum TaxID=80876 RepID=A0A1N7Q9A7_9PROT|nr:fluoride efflux transporter CrcB [Insolitispirillum peregrinum]SIT19197.1 camphor resistance protein CrcB [Insolitispirillum peregrinum]